MLSGGAGRAGVIYGASVVGWLSCQKLTCERRYGKAIASPYLKRRKSWQGGGPGGPVLEVCICWADRGHPPGEAGPRASHILPGSHWDIPELIPGRRGPGGPASQQ